MSFRELQNKHKKEMDKFSKGKIFFVFGSEREIKNKFEELNINLHDLTNIGFGGYILTEYLEDFNKIIDKQTKEKKEYTLNNIYGVVKYYLWDYEAEISLSYTYDEILLLIVGLTPDEIKSNKKEINKAIKDYKKEFYEIN